MTGSDRWYAVANEGDIPSPALLIYPDRVAENLRRMAALAGGAIRLRPHVKTHKLSPIVALELEQGIDKFKAATIAEAEMCAAAGARDVLLAAQPVGPHVARFVALARTFPQTRISCLADNASTIASLGAAAAARSLVLNVLLDVDVGMQRTGAPPGPEAEALYAMLARTPGLQPSGLHSYDGHLHASDRTLRARQALEAIQPLLRLRDRLRAAGLPVPHVVAGGTPTLPILAACDGLELGAGTAVLWDDGYAQTLPDLDFLFAAVLLTRVVSRPAPDRLCLDLGHKAVASEMPPPRARLLGLEDARSLIHNEEHLVVETARAARYPVGATVYAVPRHICPTVALHSEATVVRDGRAVDRWSVTARGRRLTL